MAKETIELPRERISVNLKNNKGKNIFRAKNDRMFWLARFSTCRGYMMYKRIWFNISNRWAYIFICGYAPNIYIRKILTTLVSHGVIRHLYLWIKKKNRLKTKKNQYSILNDTCLKMLLNLISWANQDPWQLGISQFKSNLPGDGLILLLGEIEKELFTTASIVTQKPYFIHLLQDMYNNLNRPL